MILYAIVAQLKSRNFIPFNPLKNFKKYLGFEANLSEHSKFQRVPLRQICLLTDFDTDRGGDSVPYLMLHDQILSLFGWNPNEPYQMVLDNFGDTYTYIAIYVHTGCL